MLENYNSSISKWNSIFEINPSQLTKEERKAVWDSEIWTACGFCVEFVAVLEINKNKCRNCCLNPKHCYRRYDSPIFDKSTMSKIKYAFMNAHDTEFHAKVKHLINVFYKHKKCFDGVRICRKKRVKS